MQPIGLNEIREKYLSFFESKDHLRHPSFPLVPQGDSSLLLVNSGMAPLKPYFSGEAVPPRKRMTTCQKCVRVIDIEVVGKTDRHCTFFEMLGHFSFGDYFKREAIAWTWEFFTQTMGIDPNRLHCSVYLDDDETWDIWTKEIGVDETRMVRLGKEDNFWDIGSGPCGPCSEIYFDRGAEVGCGKPDCKPGCDCDRFVEVGNNVFTQFDNDGAGNYTPLAQKNIDFGMGLERLACVVQGVSSVFEVDTIARILQHICTIAGAEYGRAEKPDISLRLITDHIRSTVMLVGDGVLPSNEGRGYVLRRLLRRAARHGRLLGVKEPFLQKLSDTVIAESGDAYPELREKRDYILKVVGQEEERFAKTIDAGLQMLMAEMRSVKGKVFPGAPAFKLYDTFGFPVDLTLEILHEHQMELDRPAFDTLMEAQRKQARDAHAALGSAAWEKIDLGLDASITTEFTGHDTLTGQAQVLALLAGGAVADAAGPGQAVAVVLDETPFYAESGGQIYDTGEITTPDAVIKVDSVKKLPDGKFLHTGEVVSGEVVRGQSANAAVDAERRRAVMRAHSATHLLHKALRETLGSHVEQAGSLVEPDRIRFDFTHFAAMTPAEIKAVNRQVNELILAGLPIDIREMPMEQAKAEGALALFGEKYEDVVRVVKMGDESVELCGGTHLTNTSLCGSFWAAPDSSVAAGVRRIEARTGLGVLERAEEIFDNAHQAAALLKTDIPGLRERIAAFLEEGREHQREIDKLRQKIAGQQADGLMDNREQVNGFTFIPAVLQNADTAALRQMGDAVRDKESAVVAIFASVAGDKITFLAVCGKEAVARGAKAGAVIGKVAQITGGRGGGKPDSAMGGGKDPSKLQEAFAAVKSMLEEL